MSMWVRSIAGSRCHIKPKLYYPLRFVVCPLFTHVFCVISFCSTALWLPATTALAKDAPTVVSELSGPGPQTIPAEDVPEEAVRTTALLETLIPSEESHAALKKVEAETNRLLGDIEVRLTRIQFALAGTPKVRSMQEWEVDLLGMLAALESLGKDLSKRLEEPRKALKQVDENVAKWKATQDEARHIEDAAAVRSRIDSTVTALNQAQDQISGQRDAILSLRDQLVDPTANIDRTVKQLRTKIQERLTGIFTRDRPAIWNTHPYDSIRTELREGGAASLAIRYRLFEEYAREHIPLIAFQIILFVGMAIGLRLLSSRARELAEEDYDLRQASLVFALPTSMALVISLSLTSPLHPTAPYLVQLVAYSVVVIPAALIVSRLLTAINRPVVWALVFMFLIDRLRDLLETLPTLERAIFLVEIVASVLFLLWLRQRKRIAELPQATRRDSLFRVVRKLTGVSLTLFAIAITAEIMGLGDLADLIGSGTLRSAYSALFIYAGLKVVQSLVAYLIILWPISLLKMISANRWRVRRHIETILQWLAFVLWAYLTLVYFGLDTPLKDGVSRIFGAQLSIGALAISLGDILVVITTIWLTFVLARLIDFILTEDVYSRVRLPRGVPYAISTLTRYTLIFLGFLFALAAAGIELSKLSIMAGGLGVGIGFGLQNVVSNFISGLILLFERPLKVGDNIELGAVKGEILRIGIRASSVRTGDGAEVIVPNSKLISESVTNWTFVDRRRRIQVNVGVTSSINAQEVIDILKTVAREHPGVLGNPPPRAYLVQLGENNLEFVLRVWIAEFGDEAATRSELNTSIQKALVEDGIFELIRTADPESM